jgi:hypothetical protein
MDSRFFNLKEFDAQKCSGSESDFYGVAIVAGLTATDKSGAAS